MLRDEMIRFVMCMLRTSEDARIFGGLRREAEILVDDYLQAKESA